MNVRHPMDVLHSFSTKKKKNYDRMDLRLLYFDVTIYASIAFFYLVCVSIRSI